MLRLIALIMVIAGGKFAYDEFNRPGSQSHDDYESIATNCSARSGYSTRQPGNVGGYDRRNLQFGPTTDLDGAFAACRAAYSACQDSLRDHGERDQRTLDALDEYREAKDRYAALRASR